MGWMWTCFGGRNERFRRAKVDGRARQRNRDRSSMQAPSPNLNSLGVQLKSAREASAYEELFQPKQAVSGMPNGSKLFKRKSVRRAKSCGSSTAFESGAKRLFDKNVEARTIGRIDRLQEEVEALRKRLAEEEEEARKLRHEVSYLRSCGVLQSPDRPRISGGFEKEMLLRDDKSQRNSPSWLGLTLSPASRFKLEEQLRSMAADEMSRVPGKDLTNGQKALIVATKLWRSQGSPLQDNQNKRELLTSSCTSNGDGSHGGTLGENQLLSEEGTDPNHVDHKTALTDNQLATTIHDPSFRDDLPPGEESTVNKPTELTDPQSTSSEGQNFSFHPSTNGDKVYAQHLCLENPAAKLLQRVPSCPEQMTGQHPGPVLEKGKSESPRRSCSLPIVGTGSQTSDSDPGQARRFIDLRYQELEEKLLKSPKKERVSLKSTPESSPSRQRRSGHLDGNYIEQEASPPPMSEDISRSEAQASGESGASLSSEGNASPSTPAMKPFFVGKSGRLWQPLSPVREVDSGLSSGEDVDSVSTSQVHLSDSVDSSTTSDLKSSIRSMISGSEWEQQDDFPHHLDDIGEVADEDLFTLSPRRLHQSYNPWGDADTIEDKVVGEHKVGLDSDSAPGTGWASNDEADLDDLEPIQCQSPAFSPKQKSGRNKFVKGKALKVEEYPRDKYYKEMGFKVEEFLSSSDSCKSTDTLGSEKENQHGTNIPPVVDGETESPGAGKENRDGIEVLPVPSGGQVTMVGSPKEASPLFRKSLTPSDLTLSQDHDHLVLASIENLPKWIECQGVSTAPVDNRESQLQDSNIPEQEETGLAQKDATPERIILHCNSKADGEVIHQVEKDGLLTEFSVRHDEALHQVDENLEAHRAERLRLSLHGFVYQDEHVLDHAYSSAMADVVHEQHHRQNGTELDIFANLGRQGKLDSVGGEGKEGMCSARSEKGGNVELVRPSPDSQASNGEQVDGSQEETTHLQAEKKRSSLLDNDDRHNGLSHAQSLGYSIQIPKLFLGSDLAFESSSVGGDSEFSRDGDETFHDCESPTPSESNPEPAQFGSLLAETNPEVQDVGTSKFHSAREEVYPVWRTSDISPDDRPILGTVATHWGESNKKSHREWDGLGIPNSTSKFKEDQRVNWHTTPFETRLEQALAKMPSVPELSNQRRLFEGVAMM